jgi:hypothetical protein
MVGLANRAINREYSENKSRDMSALVSDCNIATEQ